MFTNEKITKDLSRAEKFFENIIAYTVGSFTLEDMIKNSLESINIVDVRDYDNFIEEHIPYALNIPISDIEKHYKILDKSRVTIVYTHNDSCEKAYKAALVLLKENYPCVVLRGGFEEWKYCGLDIIKKSFN